MPMTELIKGNLQKVIDHLPVVVFEYTFFPDGFRGFTYISPRCEELLGLDPEVIIDGQLSFDNYIHPDDRHTFHHSVMQSVNSLQEWSWRGRCRGKDGYLWIETKSNPTRTLDGRIVYHGVFSDIGERMRLEVEHRLTEQRYRSLVEQLPLGIAIHSKGKLRYANEATARLIGARSPQELIGMEAMQFVHPDFKEQVSSRVASVLQGHSVAPMEVKFIRLDGRVIDVESMGHPAVYEGEPAVQIIFADITERKKAEAGFQKAEKLFFQLFESTPLAIVLLDEKSQVVRVNKGFEELFGYSQPDLTGRVLTDAIVPTEFEKEGDEINNMITENKVVRVETVRQRKNGERVSVIIYGIPVVLHDEKIGIFGMYVDITERQKVEEELKVRNAELDNFVYKVSHDLRAPLSSVLGLANLAAMPGNNDDLSSYIKLMGQKATQLDHFISDVLSHSKNLKLDVSVSEVDLKEIITRTFQDLNYLAGAGEMSKNISISGMTFFSDPWRVAEIFRNLISNAIKYRKLNHAGAVVSIAAVVTEERCDIVVEDNGIGVEPEHVQRVFEMFYRASGQSDGSGLGLYIVKNAIDKLGGTVSVTSEMGKGTRFAITLPNRHSK